MMLRFSARKLAMLLFALSAAPLVLALISQYGFGLHPCELCLWQRVPLVLLMLAALLALVRARWALVFSAGLWLLEAALALYHVGVEQRWWQSASGCSTNVQPASSLEALRAQIMSAPIVACDTPELVVLGLSMAGWNGLYSLCMALCLSYLLNKRGQETERSRAKASAARSGPAGKRAP